MQKKEPEQLAAGSEMKIVNYTTEPFANFNVHKLLCRTLCSKVSELERLFESSKSAYQSKTEL